MPKWRMSLADLMARLEADDRLPQSEDFTGVRGKTMFGDRFSSDDIRDMYAEGNAAEDDMTSVDVPSDTVRRFPEPGRLADKAEGGFDSMARQQAEINKLLSDEGLDAIDNASEADLALINDAKAMGVTGPSVGDPMTIEELTHHVRAAANEPLRPYRPGMGGQAGRFDPRRGLSEDAQRMLVETGQPELSTDPTFDDTSRFSRTPDERALRRTGASIPQDMSPGRAARYAYESKPSRPAYFRPELAPQAGEPSLAANINRFGVMRGDRGDVHMTVMAGHVPELRKYVTGKNPIKPRLLSRSAKEDRFWDDYANLSDETRNNWEKTAGFTNREGRFLNRKEQAATQGRGETFRAADAEERVGNAGTVAAGRAESLHEPDQVRRSMQARRVQGALSGLREERAAIEGTGQAARVQEITRTIGRLKNFGIRRGLLGLAGTVGSMAGIQHALDAVEGSVEEAQGL